MVKSIRLNHGFILKSVEKNQLAQTGKEMMINKGFFRIPNIHIPGNSLQKDLAQVL